MDVEPSSTRTLRPVFDWSPQSSSDVEMEDVAEKPFRDREVFTQSHAAETNKVIQSTPTRSSHGRRGSFAVQDLLNEQDVPPPTSSSITSSATASTSASIVIPRISSPRSSFSGPSSSHSPTDTSSGQRDLTGPQRSAKSRERSYSPISIAPWSWNVPVIPMPIDSAGISSRKGVTQYHIQRRTVKNSAVKRAIAREVLQESCVGFSGQTISSYARDVEVERRHSTKTDERGSVRSRLNKRGQDHWSRKGATACRLDSRHCSETSKKDGALCA